MEPVERRWSYAATSSNVTTARDERHLVLKAVMDRTASSTVLSRRWSTATGLDLSASTVRRRLLRVARMRLRRFPLSRDHQRLRLQWARERYHCCAEWRNVVFSDESRFNTMAAYVFDTMLVNAIKSLHSSAA